MVESSTSISKSVFLCLNISLGQWRLTPGTKLATGRSSYATDTG